MTGGVASSSSERNAAADSFDLWLDLLRSFVEQRRAIVERIEGLLNAQRKPVEHLQDIRELERRFAECFAPAAGAAAIHLASLDEARWASGFKPQNLRGVHNDLVNPAEMASRAFLMWRQTRWPGNYGRSRYAETLFNLHALRLLMLLGLRLWDGEPEKCVKRLAGLQSVLDAVWRTSPADQPVLLRDARWLIPLAQSPTTEELAGYFAVAAHVAEHLPTEDALEVHRASAVMAGGHLRSQLRHVATQNGVDLDDRGLLLDTRRSNALDLALLIQALVPLLAAYEEALQSGNEEQRLEWADAICQGLSPDPELFVNRHELLGPYSVIDYLFIVADDDGYAAHTAVGERHQRLLRQYEALMGRLARPLHDDCTRFRPAPGAYSPYGVLYGFSSQLFEHMALKSLQPDAETRFSLENAFRPGGAEELAWVSGWRKLPHVPREVVALFEYPQRFAEEVFARVERALARAAKGDSRSSPVGRLVLGNAAREHVPELPPRFVFSSDRKAVAAGTASWLDPGDLLRERTEGEFIVSYCTADGWSGLSKDVLTEMLGVGSSARVLGLPARAAAVLRLACPNLVEARGSTPAESA